jgi:hypothetical protein
MVAEGSATSRSLILACSRRKRLDEELLPAVERYDGPAFRVLRRFVREKPPEAPDVLILSAEHGLISQDMPIAAYDRMMTPARARELRPLVFAEFNRVTASHPSRETLVCAGRQYLSALRDDDGSLPQDANIKVCTSTSGKQLAELHDWLHCEPPRLRYNSTMLAEGNKVRIRGVEIALTPKQVFEIAANALAEGWGNPGRYESWYVEMDERRVAPKWLVSQLTGMTVASFHSDEARRVLQQLGLKVRRA